MLGPIIDSVSISEELDLKFVRGLAGDGSDNDIYIYNADTITKKKPYLNHSEYSITGPDNNTVMLSVFAPENPTTGALPRLYHIHGGGMVSGDRFTAVTPLIDLLDKIMCVVVSVEYRLALETRAPGLAEDCYYRDHKQWSLSRGHNAVHEEKFLQTGRCLEISFISKKSEDGKSIFVVMARWTL